MVMQASAQDLSKGYLSGGEDAAFGELLPGSNEQADLWWASSGWKISRERLLPSTHGEAVVIRAARNEAEAAQWVIRPRVPLKGLRAGTGALSGPAGAIIPATAVETLRVRYVTVEHPTDKTAVAGDWPDPLPPMREGLDLSVGLNQPFWVRIKTPADAPAGVYRGLIHLTAEGYSAEVPLSVEVFNFSLPDRMTCTTAFGADPQAIFKYHGTSDPAQKRLVLAKYWASYSAHHISPYDPAPLDPFEVKWPAISDLKNTDPAAIKPGICWEKWDSAMTEAFDKFHFNTVRLPVVGMGSGTFHSRTEPEILGFSEDSSEYKVAFRAYCQTVQEHLREKGWLDKAYVYWFDEPDPKDYEFVMNGFRKLKEAAPDITRMLTEEVNPVLIGGPNLWCPISNNFDLDAARVRSREGETFWWYICTGPKAPYCTLFIDHPGTELRVWLWQTWQRNIQGILIWQSNYWHSEAAYPDPDHPQNPYEDPMGWMHGYDTPSGVRKQWGNGDGRFVYPPEAAADGRPEAPVLDGPVDSIRWEMLRDGIEDYEYLVILKNLIEAKRTQLGIKAALYENLLEVPQSISRSVTEFTVDPAPLEKHRIAVARAIEAVIAEK
jgi:hypothetical protein